MVIFSRAVFTRAFVSGPFARRQPPSATFARDRILRWSSQEGTAPSLRMENLYKEWTLEEDETLWKYRNESVDQLAARLGRGLRGVESRLSKIRDVNSAAYQRLFVEQTECDNDESDMEQKKEKLIPAGEVIRRVKWDYQLDEKDFSILHHDRVEDKIIETAFTAKNADISGNAAMFVDALPEHRIVAIKYKERVVWDRESRTDNFFARPGIIRIIEDYEEWRRRREEEREFNRKRQAEVTLRLQRVLGASFDSLKELSAKIHAASKESILSKKEIEDYVERATDLFRHVRDNPALSGDPTIIPMSDYEALDMLSELVALMPDESTRAAVLTEISTAMKIALGRKIQVSKNKELPDISEEDIAESFVRGSGKF